MKPVYSLLALLLALLPALPSLAGELPPSPRERHDAFCRPEVPAVSIFNPREEWASRYIAFLKNPAATIEKVEAAMQVSPADADGNVSIWLPLEVLIEYASACEHTLLTKQFLAEEGCHDASGAKHSGSDAIRLCEGLVNKYQRKLPQ